MSFGGRKDVGLGRDMFLGGRIDVGLGRNNVLGRRYILEENMF